MAVPQNNKNSNGKIDLLYEHWHKVNTYASVFLYSITDTNGSETAQIHACQDTIQRDYTAGKDPAHKPELYSTWGSERRRLDGGNVWTDGKYQIARNADACIEIAKVRCRGMISGDIADQV